jgi:catechol 2,3-dioxygenase-like lactoylglutathione lyase family enzyme
MLGSRDIVAFVATTDADKARAFYGEVLGLRLIADDGFALVFDANGTMLRVVKVRDFAPLPFTVLGWHVDDIAAAARGLASAGVTFERFPGMEQDALGVWTSPGGSKVAWFKDPDGNTLSLSQDG